MTLHLRRSISSPHTTQRCLISSSHRPQLCKERHGTYTYPKLMFESLLESPEIDKYDTKTKWVPEETPTRTRRVRFETDSNNEIVKRFRETDFILTDSDKKKMWWSVREINEISYNAKRVVIHYRKHRKDFADSLYGVFVQCSRLRSSSHSYFQDDDKRDGCSIKNSPFDRKYKKLNNIRPSRGLERHIHENLLAYRASFIKTILDVQSKVPPGMDSLIKERLLYAKSVLMSRGSRNFALFLACQDAKEAYKRESKAQKEVSDDSDSDIDSRVGEQVLKKSRRHVPRARVCDDSDSDIDSCVGEPVLKKSILRRPVPVAV